VRRPSDQGAWTTIDQTLMDETRIDAVVAGRAQMSILSAVDRVVAHDRIDRAIEQRVATAEFGALARAAGVTTVAITADGEVVRTSPDDTTQVVSLDEVGGTPANQRFEVKSADVACRDGCRDTRGPARGEGPVGWRSWPHR
jgi:hypothetical protein